MTAYYLSGAHYAHHAPGRVIATMKVLLRNKTTGLYYLTPTQWTEDRALAYDFKTGERALTAGLETGGFEVEMVYAFKDSRHDFVVPINADALT